MGFAVIAPLVATVLPGILDIIQSAIGLVNHSKTLGVKLTPDQAATANAAATQAAQIGIKAAVDSGKITQAQVDALLPNAQAVSQTVQMVYGTAPASPQQITTEQAMLMVIQSLIAENASKGKP